MRKIKGIGAPHSTSRGRICLVALPFCLMTLMPSPAVGQEGVGRAALMTIPSPQATPGEAAQAILELTTIFEEQFSERFIDPEELVGQIGGNDPDQRQADAASNAEEARQVTEAFENLELAVELLEGTTEQYLRLLPLLQSVDEPLRLLHDLATVFLALQRPEHLEATLAEAARLDPTLPMDVENDPRRLVAAAQEVRVERVPSLSLLNPNIAIWFSERLGVQRLAVGRLGEYGEYRLEIYDERGRRRARLDTTVDNIQSTSQRLARELGLGELAFEATDEEEDHRRPWYRSWWFITSIIVGTAALTVGLVFGINSATAE